MVDEHPLNLQSATGTEYGGTEAALTEKQLYEQEQALQKDWSIMNGFVG